MADHEALIERINSVIFTPVRAQVGYEMGHVDDFLDGLVVALRQGRPVEALVDMVRFSTVRFREGYAIREVDEFLASVVAESKGVPAQETPSMHEDAAPAAEPTPLEVPGVIEEQHGLFKRLFRR
ncbi:DivIVA domain-containing protein [Nocardioides sp. Root140]|uniref:DivIVA domain-containing protein n=1 Tax=Nocardioides sp. Root140 TaxID=1736460 RepID=UPI0006F6AA0D|nr:DivIVA domain-containing protein [Nocardioides sp. Root140]KQY64135.1 hypothetical protein ASD30_04005 [Nocardioides sp. Root140]